MGHTAVVQPSSKALLRRGVLALGLLPSAACGGEATAVATSSKTGGTSDDASETGGPRDGQAGVDGSGADESGAAIDDGAGPPTDYAVPGDRCESSLDCNFNPDEVNYGSRGVCAPTGCGEPTCHDFVPCAAPDEPATACSCEGEVVSSSVGCSRISNHAFVFSPPFGGTMFEGGCDGGPPERWSVRLEVTGWDAYEDTEVSITGPVVGGKVNATVVAGAISTPVDARTPSWDKLFLFFDSNDDGECDDGEYSFDTLSTANAITGEVVVTPAADVAICN